MKCISCGQDPRAGKRAYGEVIVCGECGVTQLYMEWQPDGDDVMRFEGVEVHENNRGTLVTSRVFNYTHLFGFLYALTSIYTGYKFYTDPQTDGIYLVIAGVFTVVFAYFGLSGLLNRYRVHIEDGKIKVGTTPFPGMFRLDCRADEVKQFYVKEKVVKGQHGREYFFYSLRAIMENDKERRVSPFFKGKEKVMFLEMAVERALGIKNTPVAGEAY